MRKISPVRWTQDPHEILCLGDIDADALTDLHTEDNAISTWYVGNRTDREVMNAVLALVSGFKSLDSIDVAFLDEQSIISAGININASEGVTKIKEFADLHRDIVQLDAKKMLMLTNMFLQQIYDNQMQSICAEEIALWLVQAINDGKLEFCWILYATSIKPYFETR